MESPQSMRTRNFNKRTVKETKHQYRLKMYLKNVTNNARRTTMKKRNVLSNYLDQGPNYMTEIGSVPDSAKNQTVLCFGSVN